MHLHRFTPEQNPDPTHPIMNKEKHTLFAGMANKLLNELRKDLAQIQQDKTNLAHMLIKQQEDLGKKTITKAAMLPKIEIFHQILKHTKPFESIMQYHRVYGGLNLVLNNIPLRKAGCNLELSRLEEIWRHTNVVARNTLVFMWCLSDLKTPLGVMEVLLGCPLFTSKEIF